MPQTTPRRAAPDRRYFELVRLFPLVPIADDAHLDEATAMLHVLTPGEAAGTLDADERAYLDVLVGLVAAYEDADPVAADATAAGVVRGVMDGRGWTQADFARDTGVSPSTVNAVLRGKRHFTAAQAAALGAHFKLNPAAFLPPVTAAGR